MDDSKGYGKNQNVLLTDEEYNELIQSYGKDLVDDTIDRVDGWIQTHGNKHGYSSHKETIKKWIERSRKAKPERDDGVPYYDASGNPPFDKERFKEIMRRMGRKEDGKI